MPETEFPGLTEELAALDRAARQQPEDDLTEAAQRRVEYDRRRETVEQGLEQARARRILEKIELQAAELRRRQPEAVERWRRLTGRT